MFLIIITYLAGVLTILSPCILPVLPFVFSKAQQSFVKSGLPLLLGMAITFSGFSVLAVVGGEWIAQANETGRIVAMVLLTVFGLSLIFPHLSEKIFEPLSRIGNKVSSGGPQEESFMGSFLIGVSTGLLWAPCAGPILGLVLTGAAAQGDKTYSVFLLLAYSAGAATSLALALLAGNKVFKSMKKFLGVDRVVKKGLGILVLIGVAAIAFHLDRTVLTQFSKIETASLENKLLRLVQGDKAVNESGNEGPMPELSGAIEWINSKPLTKADLRGKVVMIDFWTYSCINCIRTLPYVKAWAEKYKNDDFVVIGVHAPEFAFEKNIGNVHTAVKELGIEYPVALDNDYKIWNAFKNQYWPAHYFVDGQGQIRHHQFGEGHYDESEKMIRQLLMENGKALKDAPVEIAAVGAQAARSGMSTLSPETYIGYSREKNFAGVPEMQEDEATMYSWPRRQLKADEWALSGQWLVSAQKAEAKKGHAKIVFRFRGRDLHLVLGGATKFKVTLDGHAPGLDHGTDTDADGQGSVDGHRLYQLIRLQKDGEQEHLFEIEFIDSGVEAYAFTFG